MCSVLATVVLMLFFDSTQGPQTDRISDRLLHITDVAILGILLPNLVFSIVDKLLSGFVALVVIDATGPTRHLLSLTPPAPERSDGA